MKKILAACYLYVAVAGVCLAANVYPIDSLQKELDNAIAQRHTYDHAKKQHIASIRQELDNPNLTPQVRYYIHNRLFTEYEAYKYDSACYYITKNIELAYQQQNQQWLNESRILKAQILSIAGLYVEALDLIQQVQPCVLTPQARIDYYRVMANLYLYMAEYTEGDVYSKPYLRKMVAYQDTLCTLIDSTSFLGVTTLASVYSNNGNQPYAEEMLLNYLQSTRPATRNYSIVVSTLASYKSMHADTLGAKYYHMLSALSDTKAAIKENKSLRSLAEIYYQENQLERADYLMKLSMDDANFFNARLRNVQASKMLPLIARQYQLDQEQSRRLLQYYLIASGVLLLLLIVALIMVFYQNKKKRLVQERLESSYVQLKAINRELTNINKRFLETNTQLTESNRVKEEYVSRFLMLCSGYIDAMDSYRKMLSKMANAAKWSELQQQLKSTRFIDEELDTFYKNFDYSFLNIYPHFVEGFNQLFAEPDRQYPPKGTLTAELRIYALVRLGISDTATIATILRYSVTTIYTYRSKLKKKSLQPDTFEQTVLLL